MSIRVVCPNGHILRAQESFAGKKGLCPVCKAPVRVPQREQDEVSEDTILGYLASEPTARITTQPTTQARAGEGGPGLGARGGAEGPTPPKKSCSRCNREIPARTHVCPYCQSYIAGLGDL